jgi:hypothetical protein
MELFGLLFAVPVTFVTSLVFCLSAHFVFRRWARVQHFCTLGATLVVVSLLVETFLSLWIGPFYLDHRFGIFYWILHGIGFFFGPPAIGVLVFFTVSRFVRFTTVRVGLATAVCWIACMATLLANIMVDEDINGIKSSGSRPRNSIFPQ